MGTSECLSSVFGENIGRNTWQIKLNDNKLNVNKKDFVMKMLFDTPETMSKTQIKLNYG